MGAAPAMRCFHHSAVSHARVERGTNQKKIVAVTVAE